MSNFWKIDSPNKKYHRLRWFILHSRCCGDQSSIDCLRHAWIFFYHFLGLAHQQWRHNGQKWSFVCQLHPWPLLSLLTSSFFLTMNVHSHNINLRENCPSRFKRSKIQAWVLRQPTFFSCGLILKGDLINKVWKSASEKARKSYSLISSEYHRLFFWQRTW